MVTWQDERVGQLVGLGRPSTRASTTPFELNRLEPETSTTLPAPPLAGEIEEMVGPEPVAGAVVVVVVELGCVVEVAVVEGVVVAEDGGAPVEGVAGLEEEGAGPPPPWVRWAVVDPLRAWARPIATSTTTTTAATARPPSAPAERTRLLPESAYQGEPARWAGGRAVAGLGGGGAAAVPATTTGTSSVMSTSRGGGS